MIEPSRPRDLSPRELGFTRRRPVRWLAPILLAGTAVRVVGAYLFGANLDKRELQGALPSQVYDHSGSDELWFDYVADIGDGFDATYSIAWLLAQRELTVPGPDGAPHQLPRGKVLVMGGDEVYPTPSWRGYEDRAKGPYLAALPKRASDPPALYALPGNHDWYDGLTAFLRLFAKRGWFGGWRTQQSRSYFALQLPHRWWLYAIDEQFDAYLDDPQLGYFRTAAQQLRPGDRVILCTSRPTWVYGAREPHAYDTVDYFLRKIVEPTGASVPLVLTGDMHHYARYQQVDEPVDEPAPPDPRAGSGPGPGDQAGAGEDGPAQDEPAQDEPAQDEPAQDEPAQDGPVEAGPVEDEIPPPASVPTAAARGRTLVTCGGGGAFLYATHVLPPALTLPPPGTLRRGANPPRRYELRETYPSIERSRRYARGVFFRLLGRNPGFAALLGLVQTLLMYAFITSGSRVLTLPVLVLSVVVLGGTVGWALVEKDIHGNLPHWLLGIGHGLAHLGLGVLGAVLWWHTPLAHLPGPLPVLLAGLVYLPLAGVTAALLTAAYLLVASRWLVNTDELFASQSIEDTKCFLRLHLDGAGNLTVYPIGLDEAGREWVAAPEAPAGSPWIAPVRPLRPRLIESPYPPC